MTCFEPVQREHVLDAMIEVANGDMHGFSEPVRYRVEHRGRQYPAKAVLGIAREFATGHRTQWSDFHGSEKLEPTFRRLGFRFINSDSTI